MDEEPLAKTFIRSFDASKVIKLDHLMTSLYTSDISGCPEPTFTLTQGTSSTEITSAYKDIFEIGADKKIAVETSSAKAQVQQYVMYVEIKPILGIIAYKKVQVSFVKNCEAEVISLPDEQPIVKSYTLSFAANELIKLDQVVPSLFVSDTTGCDEAVYTLVKDLTGAALDADYPTIFTMVSKEVKIQISSATATAKQYVLYIKATPTDGIPAYKQLQVTFINSCQAEVISVKEEQPLVKQYTQAFAASLKVTFDTLLPGLFDTTIPQCPGVTYSLTTDIVGTALSAADQNVFTIEETDKLKVETSKDISVAKTYSIYVRAKPSLGISGYKAV